MMGLYFALIDEESDKVKFAQLYNEYEKIMHWRARQILQDDKLAEDAVQEAFLRVAKNIRKVGEVFCPQTRAFVVIITENVAKTMFAKENSTVALDELEPMIKGEDFTFEAVSNKALVAMILSLEKKDRDVLYLRGVYDYSFSEIASLLGISVEAAKKRAQRGRTKLKALIGEDDE